MAQAQLTPELVNQLILLVNQRYPNWQGFSDQRFIDDELTYKQDAVETAQELLNREDLIRLIKEEDFTELKDRVDKVAHAGKNLLYLSVPTAGDISVIHTDGLEEHGFYTAFFDLLYSSDNSALRVEKFSNYLAEHNLTNKWTFATYFLYLLNPETEMFVKPSTTKWFLRFCDHESTLPSRPNEKDYQLILDLCNQLRKALSEFHPTNLIDIQGFLWVAKQVETTLPELGKNFKELFGTIDDTLLAFKFLETAAAALQIQSPKDPLIALTFFKPGKDVKLHFTYANWLVIGFHGNNQRIHDIEICLLKDSLALPYKWVYDFNITKGDPLISLHALAFEDFKEHQDELIKFFQNTLVKVHTMFGHWKASPQHRHNRIELAEAILDEDIRDDLLFKDLPLISSEIESPTRYWKIAPGRDAWNWDTWKNENIIAIGWEEIGDLSGKTKDEICSLYDERIKDYPDWGEGGKYQLARFMEINIGDRIIANKGKGEILGIGTVVGEYSYIPNTRHGHHIPVQWDDLNPRSIDEGGWAMTILELDEEKFIKLINSPKRHPEYSNPFYTVEQISEDTSIAQEDLHRWIRAIERKKQVVFYGPPGTGKTFVAEKLARHLIGGGSGFSELIQFHPEVSYEDFIQGIRPRERDDGGLGYPIVPGRFLEFCNKASQTDDICVLIIDEINRANLSRVFGELMYLLEYRDKSIKLSAGKQFKIPSNVRIIGTMNTADRSIALVDHALRRRFAFLSLYPEYEILRNYHLKVSSGFDPENLIQVLRELNKQIMDRHYFIGPSYFLREDIQEHLKDIWQMEIEPYLEEFFFDQPDHYQKFTWEKIKSRIGL